MKTGVYLVIMVGGGRDQRKIYALLPRSNVGG